MTLSSTLSVHIRAWLETRSLLSGDIVSTLRLNPSYHHVRVLDSALSMLQKFRGAGSGLNVTFKAQ